MRWERVGIEPSTGLNATRYTAHSTGPHARSTGQRWRSSVPEGRSTAASVAARRASSAAVLPKVSYSLVVCKHRQRQRQKRSQSRNWVTLRCAQASMQASGGWAGTPNALPQHPSTPFPSPQPPRRTTDHANTVTTATATTSSRSPPANLQVGAAQLLQLILIKVLLHALSLYRPPRLAAAAEGAGLPPLFAAHCKAWSRGERWRLGEWRRERVVGGRQPAGKRARGACGHVWAAAQAQHPPAPNKQSSTHLC